jgi:UDPglucose 6-dehydrogenase
MVLTDWDEFAQLDPVALHSLVRRPAVIDGRLLLDAAKWRATGWHVDHAGWGER